MPVRKQPIELPVVVVDHRSSEHSVGGRLAGGRRVGTEQPGRSQGGPWRGWEGGLQSRRNVSTSKRWILVLVLLSWVVVS